LSIAFHERNQQGRRSMFAMNVSSAFHVLLALFLSLLVVL